MNNYNYPPSTSLPSHPTAALGIDDETRTRQSSRKRRHSFAGRSIADEAHARPLVRRNQRRVGNNHQGRRRRRSSPSKISCASFCILSILRASHAEAIDDFKQQRLLQNGITIGSVTTVDLDQCYAHLADADSNPTDGFLSQSEFLSFVQASADGLLDANQYGMPITEFQQLPQEFVGVYNFFACGSANFGCPSVIGIDITGVSEIVAGGEGAGDVMSIQQETQMYQLCRFAQVAVDKLTPRPTGAPTDRPSEGGTDGDPTPVPTTGSPSGTPTASPTATTSCPPLYQAGALYEPDDMVSDPSGSYYKCKGYPQGEWCSQDAYAPITGNAAGSIWSDAWTYIGECVLPTKAPTTNAPTVPSEPTSLPTTFDGTEGTEGTAGPTVGPTKTPSKAPSASPTTKPTPAVVATSPPTKGATSPPTPRPVGGGNEPGNEPYTGPLATSFQYEVLNTQNLNAEGMEADDAMMAALLTETTAFVEAVVEDTFYGQSGGNGNGGGAIQSATNKNRQNDNGNGNGNPRKRLRGERNRHLLHRKLQVLLMDGGETVTISEIEDVICTALPPNPCQRITAQTILTLLNEPKDTTLLQFNNAITRSLEDPGMTFPDETGIKYVGPSSSGGSITIVPPVNDPENPPGEDPPKEESGTPNWVVPVSIGAAAVGAIVLVLFAGRRVQKRKRGGIEWHSQNISAAGSDPRSTGLENDILGSGGSPGNANDDDTSFDAEIQFGKNQHPKISPLDANGSPMHNGQKSPGGGAAAGEGSGSSSANPFMSSSSSSGSIPSADLAQSFSSTSSSDEDISGDNPREFWKRKEAEALERSARLQQQYPNQSQSQPQAQSQAQPHAASSGSGSGGLVPGQLSDESWRLSTLHEASDENMSQSGFSILSTASDDRSDKSVYRAGVEALVKEACPDQIDKIDEMMIEYEGREEVLIGHLSTMLAAKNRRPSASESESEAEDGEGRTSTLSDYTFSTMGDRSTFSSERGTLSTFETEKTNAENAGPSKASNENPSSNQPIEGGGAAATAAATSLFDSDTSLDLDPTLTALSIDNDGSSSSSAGSSDWSSDDGFSSIDTSSFATADTPDAQKSSTPLVPDISDASAVSQRVSGYHGSSKPTFIPVDGAHDGEEEEDDVRESNATRTDLDEAIQAGDWKAVGATAALLANHKSPNRSSTLESSRSTNSTPEKDYFDRSSLSVTSQERNQVRELEDLVESGDWRAVMAAASRYEEEDSEGFMESGKSMMDESIATAGDVSYKPSPVSSPDSAHSEKSISKMKAEIESLVRAVVPDELENLDEMLLQFKGREEELINTLRTMQDQEMGEEDVYAQLVGTSASSQHGDSKLSIFESDRSDSLAASSSFDNTSIENTSASSAPDELLVCSKCSMHLHKTEYSEDQILMGDDAVCVECSRLSR